MAYGGATWYRLLVVVWIQFFGTTFKARRSPETIILLRQQSLYFSYWWRNSNAEMGLFRELLDSTWIGSCYRYLNDAISPADDRGRYTWCLPLRLLCHGAYCSRDRLAPPGWRDEKNSVPCRHGPPLKLAVTGCLEGTSYGKLETLQQS